jgi:hypothetical protein
MVIPSTALRRIPSEAAEAVKKPYKIGQKGGVDIGRARGDPEDQ